MNPSDLRLRLRSKRLVMRPLRAKDAQAMYVYRSDPKVAEYQGWEPGSLQAVQDFIAAQQNLPLDQAGTWFQLAISSADDAALIGDLGMHFVSDAPGQVELGVSIRPDSQGQGLATEAMRCVLDFLFLELGKHRIYCEMDPRNVASIALVESLGMRLEAHFRQNYSCGEDWLDTLVYAKLKAEHCVPKGI